MDKDKNLLFQSWGKLIETENKNASQAKFICHFHDLKPKKGSSLSIPFKISIFKRQNEPLKSLPVFLNHGMNSIKLSKLDLKNAKNIEIYFSSLFDKGDEIRIGEMEILKQMEEN